VGNPLGSGDPGTAFIAHCQVAKPDKPSTHMIPGRHLNQRLEESGDRASRRLICSHLQSEPDVLRLRAIPALSQIVRH